MTIASIVPGLRLAAPRDGDQVKIQLREALDVDDAPTVIRFPKGDVGPALPAVRRQGSVDVLHETSRRRVRPARRRCRCVRRLGVEVAEKLEAQGHSVTAVDPRWVLPVSDDLVELARAARGGRRRRGQPRQWRGRRCCHARAARGRPRHARAPARHTEAVPRPRVAGPGPRGARAHRGRGGHLAGVPPAVSRRRVTRRAEPQQPQRELQLERRVRPLPVRPEQAADPFEPLADRVDVHVQAGGCVAWAAAGVEVGLQRLDQLGPPLGVVVEQRAEVGLHVAVDVGGGADDQAGEAEVGGAGSRAGEAERDQRLHRAHRLAPGCGDVVVEGHRTGRADAHRAGAGQPPGELGGGRVAVLGGHERDHPAVVLADDRARARPPRARRAAACAGASGGRRRRPARRAAGGVDALAARPAGERGGLAATADQVGDEVGADPLLGLGRGPLEQQHERA